MTRLVPIVFVAATLAGCDLYFSNGNQNDQWTYCAADGFYQCTNNDCHRVSATCPPNGPGFGCTTNSDCAAGCYCNTMTGPGGGSGSGGACTEGGFCSVDADCGAGFHCDTMRSSCEPNPPGCTSDVGCPQGQTCQSMTCTATCSCTTDAQAKQAGYGWCDTTRSTCMTGVNPAGTCGGTPDPTCTTAQPQCPAGAVPLLLNGCWNGNCQPFASCDTAPVCTHINDEIDCLGRADCSGVYDGLGCTKPDGTACHSGDTNCTCQSYVFAACASK